MQTAAKPVRKLSKDEREILRAEVGRLRTEGLTIKEIAEHTGHSKTVIGSLVPDRRHRADSINREVLLSWLDPMTRIDPERGYTFNGRPLNVAGDKWHRAYYRLREEGVCWGFFVLDEFCVRVLSCHIDEFFLYCEEQESCPWANGKAPDWWDEDPDWSAIDKAWIEQEAETPVLRGDQELVAV